MKNFKGILYALISSTTFGLIPLFSIFVLDSGMKEPSVLFYRLGGAALILGLIALVKKKSFYVTGPELIRIVGMGVLYAASSLGLIISYRYIPSGVSTTIHFLYPIWVTLIMMLFFKEPKSLGLLIAALVSLLGVGLLSWSSGSLLDFRGVVWVLMTVVAYGTYIVGANKLGLGRLDPLVLTFYILLSGAFMFAGYALSATGIEPITDLRVGVNLFLLALLSTVVSNYTLILAVKHIGSTVTAILGSMEPLTAVVFGIIHFKEPFDFKYAIGLALILVSVSLVILKKSRPAEKK